MSAAVFEQQLAAIRSLAGLDVAAADECAPLVQKAIAKNASAGLDPDGKAWPEKKDGGKALANVAEQIETTAEGALVVTRLTGPAVYSHYGTSRIPMRQVLPDGGSMPEYVRAAVHEGSVRAFNRLASGGKR